MIWKLNIWINTSFTWKFDFGHDPFSFSIFILIGVPIGSLAMMYEQTSLDSDESFLKLEDIFPDFFPEDRFVSICKIPGFRC